MAVRLKGAGSEIEHELMAHEVAGCRLLCDMLSTCSATSDVLEIPADVCAAGILAMFVFMVQGGDVPAALPLSATIELMHCAEFFACERVTTRVAESFLASYVYNKTPAECLTAMGLSEDTVFSDEERAAVMAEFPHMCHGDFEERTRSCEVFLAEGMTDYITVKYDAFMKRAYNKVHGRGGIGSKCRKATRDPPTRELLSDIVLRSAQYNSDFDWTAHDSAVLEPSVHRGKTVGVFAGALLRTGLRMPALITVMQRVRLSHVRKQSAYKDFARECARCLSLRASFSSSCRLNCEIPHPSARPPLLSSAWRLLPCKWHTLDKALRSLYKDADGKAVYCLKEGDD